MPFFTPAVALPLKERLLTVCYGGAGSLETPDGLDGGGAHSPKQKKKAGVGFWNKDKSSR